MRKTFLFLLIGSLFYSISCQEISKKLSSKNEPNEVSEIESEEEEEYDTLASEEETKKELSFHEELYGTNNEAENATYEKLKVDEYNNEIAKFIAGLSSEKYSELQKKPFYETHQSNISQAWEKTEGEDLEPITRWTRENQIAGNPDYKSTVFYPFSGPDILYANAFFPFAQNYVLVGLEHVGSLPHIESLSPEMLNEYLTGIRSSQRYINKHGYYMTKHMQEDFSQTELNGTVHLILYYLALTKHQILGVEEIALDNYGDVTEKKLGNIRGIKVDFANENLKNKQSVYYFKLDLSNENIEKNPGFLRFLSNQFDLNTYMKSASYILHDSHFSTLCNYVLDKSVKILQDDTGVPYSKFKNSKFDMTFFGKYTSTIKDFKNHYQPELKKALDAQAGSHDLPFIVGYSSWLGETLLIYANKSKANGSKEEYLAENEEKSEPIKTEIKKKETKIETKTDKQERKLVYKVQIVFSSRYFKEGAPEFKGLKNVGYYEDNGAYKYTIGNEASAEDCIMLRKKAQDAGFEDAFIIALFNGKRISLHQAKKISN